MDISKRIQVINESATLVFDKKVKDMMRVYPDVINLTVGEPNFYEPKIASEAGITAINEHFTHYTDSSGIDSLRKKISDKLANENSLKYLKSQITVSNGAKQALFNTLFCLLNEGDEVIVLAPYWGSYIEMIKLAQANPVVIKPIDKKKLKVTAKEIENKVTSKTKAIIINSPSNPCGCVYTKNELMAIGKVVEEHELYVISDEIYEKLIYNEGYTSIGSLSDYLNKNTVTINGFSKAFGMTGWRVGYSAAPQNLANAINTFQSQTTSNVCSISQIVAETAIKEFDTRITDTLRKNRDFLYQALKKNRSLIMGDKPDGAFYLFIDVSKTFSKYFQGQQIVDSSTFCILLLDHYKIAVIPGESFGMPQYIRISFAKDLEILDESQDRISKFLAELKGKKNEKKSVRNI